MNYAKPMTYQQMFGNVDTSQVVVVTGKNEKLKQQPDKVKPPGRHRAKVMGFTDKMDELMADHLEPVLGGLDGEPDVVELVPTYAHLVHDVR